MANILAQDVILEDLLQRQVGIVYANDHDALASQAVDDHTIIYLGYGDQTVIVLIKVEV